MPLSSGPWAEATGVSIVDGQWRSPAVRIPPVGQPEQFVGYSGELGSRNWSVLLANTGLHSRSGSTESPDRQDDAARIKDVPGVGR